MLDDKKKKPAGMSENAMAVWMVAFCFLATMFMILWATGIWLLCEGEPDLLDAIIQSVSGGEFSP